MMLHMPEVREVQFAPRQAQALESRLALQGFGRFRGQRFERLLPANRQIGECLVLGQAGTWRRQSFIAAPLMQVPQLECSLVVRQIQIDEEERVVGNLPKRVVGDLAFPAILRTLPNAVVQHAQGGLELARENRPQVVAHGGSLSSCDCRTRPHSTSKMSFRTPRGMQTVRTMSLPTALCLT